MYVSWEEAVILSLKLGSKILKSGYRPDSIIAISRGGLVPARVISDLLNIERVFSLKASLWGIGGKKYDDVVIYSMYLPIKGDNTLIVDDVVDTGSTLHKITKYIEKFNPESIKTAVLHLKPSAKYVPDYYSMKLGNWIWIIYPWTVYETIYSIIYNKIGCRDGLELDEKEIMDLFYQETGIKLDEKYIKFLSDSKINYIKYLCSSQEGP